MSKSEEVLASLVPEFREKLEAYLAWLLEERNVKMVPYFGLRTPAEQAKLWRQSRTTADVKEAIAKLKAEKAPYLASVLEKGAPANGPWATNALPGQSWHQFGEGVDCYWEVNGSPVWSASQIIHGYPTNGYAHYSNFCQSFGLTSLASIGDYGHLQLRAGSGPHKIMSWPDIDKAMKEKFGHELRNS